MNNISRSYLVPLLDLGENKFLNPKLVEEIYVHSISRETIRISFFIKNENYKNLVSLLDELDISYIDFTGDKDKVYLIILEDYFEEESRKLLEGRYTELLEKSKHRILKFINTYLNSINVKLKNEKGKNKLITLHDFMYGRLYKYQKEGDKLNKNRKILIDHLVATFNLDKSAKKELEEVREIWEAIHNKIEEIDLYKDLNDKEIVI